MGRFKMKLKVGQLTISFEFGVRRGKHGEVPTVSPPPAEAPAQEGWRQQVEVLLADSRQRLIASNADLPGVIVSLESIDVMEGDTAAGSHSNLGQWFLEPVGAELVADDEAVESSSGAESELLEILLALDDTNENPELGEVRQVVSVNDTPVAANIYINSARSFQCVFTDDGTRLGWICIKITDDGNQFQGSWHAEGVNFETPWIPLGEVVTNDAN